MRTLGIAVLGLVCGILAGPSSSRTFLRLLLDDGAFPDSKPLALLVGFLTPVVTGVVVDFVLDRRRTRERTAENRP